VLATKILSKKFFLVRARRLCYREWQFRVRLTAELRRKPGSSKQFALPAIIFWQAFLGKLEATSKVSEQLKNGKLLGN
jgi:hypothetical protein